MPLQGLTSDICVKLHQWHIVPHPRCRDVQVGLWPTDLPSNEQPQSLSAALRDIIPLQADGLVSLDGWEWTDEHAAAAAAALPALSHLQFSVGITGNCDDDVWRRLLALGPRVRRVEVYGSLDLNSYEYALLAWPWDSLYVRTLRVQTLLQLPMPVPLGSRREVQGWFVLDLIYKQVSCKPANEHILWLHAGAALHMYHILQWNTCGL